MHSTLQPKKERKVKAVIAPDITITLATLVISVAILYFAKVPVMKMYSPLLFVLLCSLKGTVANEDAKRLFDDLMREYNRLKRPVTKPLDPITVKMRLRLSQIIDVHEKDQIMTSSVWVEQEWYDPKLSWTAASYGGVNVLYVPAEMIWVPDIVLYNNADSNYNITIAVKATVHHDGRVVWNPPALYKSMCQIDVEWFPFDVQNCSLKFGSWTYDSRLLDLQHMEENVTWILEKGENGTQENVSLVWRGMDISDYYPSVEWDILEIPAKRHNRYYQSCCPDQASYVDITYYITLRRKPLFYTVNLIFPCVGISFLTILVFYLPSDSGEKITLCISILVSLTVFFLLLTELIPATSIVLPLIGKYLLFTMVMVTLSVIVTVVALNLHFRTPNTHCMPGWVKTVFLRVLPRYLFMTRPDGFDGNSSFHQVSSRSYTSDLVAPATKKPAAVTLATSKRISEKESKTKDFLEVPEPPARPCREYAQLEDIYKSPMVLHAFENVVFIADLMRQKEKNDKIDEDWKYVATVLDRLFLWIFSAACFFGTVIILLQAPSFYDQRDPIVSNIDQSQ